MVGFPLPSLGYSFIRSTCRATLTAAAAVMVTIPLVAAPAQARGPDNIADVAEKVINAVVNVSTSQSVDNRNSATPPPVLPPGSPFEEFFDEFFKNRRGQQGDNNPNQNRPNTPRRQNSLGSGFIIDPSGIVVTNNHVIADADEVTVILNDGTRLKAEILDAIPGRSRFVAGEARQAAPCGPVRGFGKTAARRMGGGDRQSVQPRRHGDGRHRVGAQPRHQFRSYDNYIQTDAAINPGNSAVRW